METKVNWLSSVKKAFSPESNEKKGQKSKKLKKKWFGKKKSAVPDSSPSEIVTVPHPLPLLEEGETVESTQVENEQTKHAYSGAVGSPVAADAADAADPEVFRVTAQADPEVVRVTDVNRFSGKSEEEVAALKIQTAFRGYLARRASRALRGLVRLKSLVQGPPVKRQTANALRCMQTLARVQTQIHSRRIRISEENQALQRQLLQKCATEIASLQMGDEWDDSLQSKEQIEANLLSKYEAAMRRERTLAYSFSHQQTLKKSTRPSAGLMFMDPNNPQWGWSWLERWMAATLPRETEKELNNDQSSTKSASLSVLASGEITKSYARHQLNSNKPSPITSSKPSRPSHRSPSTPGRKWKPATPKGSECSPNADVRSVFSVQSERNRRHSIGGALVRDDESLASSPALPSYMGSTQSAKAKSRLQSPLGLENKTPDKELAAGSAKKRLSFPASPARPRRHSGPPKVEISIAEQTVRNGGDT
ncbi:protein IQ-DOMAIN 2 [Actinidia eriantha]|uniref:protein IQ-DOMAIN 2 n=1 Tax=Actinidia eriantha TaxID=165200 RepID=UPI002583D62A|nr:protein IQ-DOMAIN 2 [Actinidia eriantha]XP_057471867.1 protein IQ-DOMAIN 2 [Actinidia eriantha]XP_057471868.1 protein IQ-DOMAIN 2 [Actinidia eriantha]